MAAVWQPRYINAFLNEKPTLAELCVHVRVGVEWHVFGALLNLDSDKLDNIENKDCDSNSKAMKMFELWLSTETGTTRRKIIETLKKEQIGQNEIADRYQKALTTKLLQEQTDQILQKNSESLSKLVLTSEIIQKLYTDGVFSKETFDEVTKLGGSLSGGPLKALSNTVSKEFNQLQIFATVLLQSKDTCTVAKDILKEYDSTAAVLAIPISISSITSPGQRKGLILNQKNTTKIRPLLLCFGSLPNSKSDSIWNFLKHAKTNPFEPVNTLLRKDRRQIEAEGISYRELIVAGCHNMDDITITNVTWESSCTHAIVSAFADKDFELDRSTVPPNINASSKCSGPLNLEVHLENICECLNECEYMPKSGRMKQDAEILKNKLSEEIALVNIWDISINEIIVYFLSAMSEHLYNSCTWLFLNIKKNEDELDMPPDPPDSTSKIVLQWRPRLHYFLRACKISQHEWRANNTCTAFTNRFTEKLKNKVQVAANHVGVSSIIEVLKDGDDVLYQKFKEVIENTPYKDVPVSWVFLRTSFYLQPKIFIKKELLEKQAEEYGITRESFDEFCKFYTSFGSIFDLTLINPEYPYIIVKPMRFLSSLDKYLHPSDDWLRISSTGEVNIVHETNFIHGYGENWSASLGALISVGLVAKVSGAQLDMPDQDVDDQGYYYYIPFISKRNLVTEVDSTAVHLFTSVDTPPIFKLACLVKHLLEKLPQSKLVPCTETNQAKIKMTDSTITIVSYSPVTKLHISTTNKTIFSGVVQVCQKIAESCKTNTPKYKFIMICSKNGNISDAKNIPSCHYHTLPSTTLCDECEKAGKINDQLHAWNEALRQGPISQTVIPNEDLQLKNEPDLIAETIAPYVPQVIPYLSEALELDESIVSAMIQKWNERLGTDKIEARQHLARKIMETGAKFSDSLDDNDSKHQSESIFETLAKQLDIYAPTMKQVRSLHCQSDVFFHLTNNLPNAYIAGQKLFVIRGDHSQSFHWDECGLKLSCPQGALSSSDKRCEVDIVALAGGQFKLPERTKLVSAVYGISVSKPLLKPLTLELQHCVALETKDQADRLKFVRAPLVGCDSNVEFIIMEGGEFSPGSWYGSIIRSHFCIVGVVQEEQSVEQSTGATDNVDCNPLNTADVIAATEQSAYFCKVYYEKIASMEWIVKLIIVRRLNALLEYMSTRHPQAIEYSFSTVLSSGNTFKFILDNHIQQLPKGWSIYRQDSNSEFKYKFIDKFVSDEVPEPPRCSMIIKAKRDPSTEEVFYYPVPLDGVDKPQQIFIYLSLESSLFTGSIETRTNMSDAEKAGKIAQEILRKHFASLGGLLYGEPLQEVARGMYAAGLVSISVNNSPNYNNLMSQFNIMLGLCRDLAQFQKCCQEFLTILSREDGPFKVISKVIADEWNKEIMDQLQLNFNFAAE